MADADSSTPQYDAIVVGAGINGLYQLHQLLAQGLSVRTLEAGSDIGGTWYWNRYPGARLDSESWTYNYFFSQELLDEWSWSEEFVGQPELERYLHLAVDKLDLRRHIELDARVVATVFDEDANLWRLTTERGAVFTARFVVATTGILSTPLLPDIPGQDDFGGEVHHTALWPAEQPELDGKRIAVVGTGSSGIQVVQEVGPRAGHLTVFQRSANWATPINNSPISPERAQELRETAAEIHALTQRTAAGFAHEARDESALAVSDDERRAFYEELWNMPGLSFYSRSYNDIYTSWDANNTLVAFLTEKLNQRVKDPETARKLTPTHGFGEKRPPLENGYYEVFNQPNVELISLTDEPITGFTPTGLATPERTIEVDVVILATGFDALTGSFLQMGIVGRNGRTLADWWGNGPRTYLGVAVHNFPNLFLMGPQGAGGNSPRAHEGLADWIAETIADLTSQGCTRIEATEAGEAEWVELIDATVQFTILKDSNSWFWGSNVPGKVRGTFPAYVGSQPELRARWADSTRNGYQGFELTHSADRATAEAAASVSAGPSIPA